MTRQRDTQRLRVYRAEWALWPAERRLSYDEARLMVDRIMASKWMQDRCPRLALKYRLGKFTLLPGRKGQRKAWARTYEMCLPDTLRMPLVVTHEMAHAMRRQIDATEPGHSWEWAACHLALVRRFLGVSQYRALRDTYKAHRVRYTKPRQLSPEARQAAVERLAKYRKTAVAG